MSDLYKPQTLKLYAQQAGSVRLTLDWFANKAFYPPRAGVHIKPLINGQAAFDAVHAAMEAARQSIDIITWGFDPAMRFKRPDGPRIGELLQTKGREGVQARVLVWSNQLARLKENTIPGAGVGGSGGTWAGSGVASGSAVDNEVLRLEHRRQHNLNLIARQQEALERSERLHREGRLPSFDPRGAASPSWRRRTPRSSALSTAARPGATAASAVPAAPARIPGGRYSPATGSRRYAAVGCRTSSSVPATSSRRPGR